MTLGDAMYSMRAIRRFRPDPIEERDLRDLLDAARQAPSGGNRQGWRFLLVTGAEKRARLGELYQEAWWAKRKDEGISGPEDIPAGKGVRQSAMRLSGEIGDTPALVLVCATARGRGAVESVIPASRTCCWRPRDRRRRHDYDAPRSRRGTRPRAVRHPRRRGGRLLRAPRLPARPLRPAHPQAPRRGRRRRLLE